MPEKMDKDIKTKVSEGSISNVLATDKYKSVEDAISDGKHDRKIVYRTENAHSTYKGKAMWGDGRYFGLDKKQVREMTKSPHTGKSTGGKVDEYIIPSDLKIKEIDIGWDAMTPKEFNAFPKGNDLKRQILREGYDGVILKTDGDLSYGGDQLVVYRNIDKVKKNTKKYKSVGKRIGGNT